MCRRVLFGDVPTDPFVQARATAIGSQIPGAIFRLASQNATTSLLAFFDSERGFLDLTTQIYVRLRLACVSLFVSPELGMCVSVS